MTAPIFISHSSKDAVMANQACQFLEEQGIKCWIAPRDIAAGARYGGAIETAIGSASALVLLVSEHSDASEQVKNEIERAVDHRKEILPVKIAPVSLSPELQYFISRRHCLDATVTTFDDVLKQLANAISSVASGVVVSPDVTALQKPPVSLPTTRPRFKRQNTILATAVSAVVLAVAFTSVSMSPALFQFRPPDPQKADSRLSNGASLLRQGKLTGATLDFEAAAKAADNLPKRKAAAANGLGWIYTLKNTPADDTRALNQYAIAVKFNDKLAAAYINRGYLQARMGHPAAAIASYRKAGEISASDPLTVSLIHEAEQQVLAQEPKAKAQIKHDMSDRRRRYQKLGEEAIQSSSLGVAVLPLQYDNTYPSRAGAREFVTQELEQALRKDNRFALIERQMLNLFADQRRQEVSALGDPNVALQVRQTLLAHVIIQGAFVRSGEHTAIRLKMVETANGEILDEFVEEQIENFEDLPQVTARLAEKLLAKVDGLASVLGTPQSANGLPQLMVDVQKRS